MDRLKFGAIFLLGLQVLFAKPMILTPQTDPVAGELEPVLIELLYEAERDHSFSDIYNNDRLQALIKKNQLGIFSGPMIGCVTPESVRIWLRTSEPAKVRIEAMKSADSEKKILSPIIETHINKDLTATVPITGLQADTEYAYEVYINEQPQFKNQLPIFKTYPGKDFKGTFEVGFGGGARYIPKKEKIWDVINNKNPIAFLFLGDNIYVNQPEYRNRHSLYYYRRQLRPEFKRMTSTTAIYSIWDDHDFGANDCAGGPEKFKPDWKFPVWNVFRNNWNNPAYGGGEELPGCWYSFNIGPVDFFMTDGRYYRTPLKKKANKKKKKNSKNKKQDQVKESMLGEEQLNWLLDSLKKSTATFKVIASGTLWTEHADKDGKDSWWGYKEERQKIFDTINKNKIEGVVLVSADRHRSEVFKVANPGGYELYEFESSKLTNDHTHGKNNQALTSYNKGNFFGMLSFDLSKKDPSLTFSCIALSNEKKEKESIVAQKYSIHHSDLRFKYKSKSVMKKNKP